MPRWSHAILIFIAVCVTLLFQYLFGIIAKLLDKRDMLYVSIYLLLDRLKGGGLGNVEDNDASINASLRHKSIPLSFTLEIGLVDATLGSRNDLPRGVGDGVAVLRDELDRRGGDGLIAANKLAQSSISLPNT